MRTFIAAIAVAAALSCAVSPAAAADTPAAASAQGADQAVAAFLEAFDSVDTDRFNAFFAEDATMFFPNGPFPQARVNGKAAITEAFGSLFSRARERGVARLGLRPLDVQIQNLGDFAVASFHLRGNGNIGRRSIVLRREAAGWRIVHFHASALEERPASGG
jgi:ketosteroid isomerase-like protein